MLLFYKNISKWKRVFTQYRTRSSFNEQYKTLPVGDEVQRPVSSPNFDNYNMRYFMVLFYECRRFHSTRGSGDHMSMETPVVTIFFSSRTYIMCNHRVKLW